MNAVPWAAWIVDAVLAVALIEAVGLVGFNVATGRGLPWRDLVADLSAGLCLMAGIRVAVGGAAWPWIALCLLGAGVAHGLDLRRRGRSRSAS